MDTDSIRDLNHLKIWCMSMQVWLTKGNDGICNFGRLVIISMYLKYNVKSYILSYKI
jgi:hypothetical protein